MKKAIIEIKDKQYFVARGDVIKVDLLDSSKQTLSFEPMLVIDGDKTLVGQPTVANVSVKAKIIEAEIKQPKVLAIRYKAKKRVHKLRGHRQRKTVLEIIDIKKTESRQSATTSK